MVVSLPYSAVKKVCSDRLRSCIVLSSMFFEELPCYFSLDNKNKSLDSTCRYLNFAVENNIQRVMFIDNAATRQHLLREYPFVGVSQGFGGTREHDHLFQGNKGYLWD